MGEEGFYVESECRRGHGVKHPRQGDGHFSSFVPVNLPNHPRASDDCSSFASALYHGIGALLTPLSPAK